MLTNNDFSVFILTKLDMHWENSLNLFNCLPPPPSPGPALALDWLDTSSALVTLQVGDIQKYVSNLHVYSTLPPLPTMELDMLTY